MFAHLEKTMMLNRARDSHFGTIVNAHWDALFLLWKNDFFFSCETVL